MGKNKTNIIVIDRFDTYQKKDDQDNQEVKYIDGSDEHNNSGGSDGDNKKQKRMIALLVAIALIIILCFVIFMNKQNNEVIDKLTNAPYIETELSDEIIVEYSDDLRDKFDNNGQLKEKILELENSDKGTTLDEANSKVKAMEKNDDKEFVSEDHKTYYKYSLKQLKEILRNHKNDVLNAVVIDNDNNPNVIVYYFKNSEYEVKPLLFSFTASQKREFFWEIEKAMGDILILDDKALINPQQVKEVESNPPYTTIYLDGGFNSILNNLQLSQEAIKRLQERH